MVDCFICQSEIKQNEAVVKLPCCLRKVKDKCQIEISCRKWLKMAKNKNFGVEKCTLCNSKITTPIEKTFISMYLTIKMIRKELGQKEINIAEDVLGEDWKKHVFAEFGGILKDKYSVNKIRNSKKNIVDSLSEYMIAHTTAILKSLENDSKDVQLLTENELPENVKEQIKNKNN